MASKGSLLLLAIGVPTSRYLKGIPKATIITEELGRTGYREENDEQERNRAGRHVAHEIGSAGGHTSQYPHSMHFQPGDAAQRPSLLQEIHHLGRNRRHASTGNLP